MHAVPLRPSSVPGAAGSATVPCGARAPGDGWHAVCLVPLGFSVLLDAGRVRSDPAHVDRGCWECRRSEPPAPCPAEPASEAVSPHAPATLSLDVALRHRSPRGRSVLLAPASRSCWLEAVATTRPCEGHGADGKRRRPNGPAAAHTPEGRAGGRQAHRRPFGRPALGGCVLCVVSGSVAWRPRLFLESAPCQTMLGTSEASPAPGAER